MGAALRRKHIWRFLEQVYREYTRDNCTLMAAAISFYVLLSLIPLLLVGLSSFGYIFDSEGAFRAVFHFLDQFVPREFGGAMLRDYLKDNRDYLKENFLRPHGPISMLGFVGWVWAASRGFATVTASLNITWDVKKPRGFIATRVTAVSMMLVVGIFMLLSVSVTSALRIVQAYRIPWLEFQAGNLPVVWQVLGWVIPTALSVLIFALCYLVLPDTRVGLRPALLGGVMAGILWEAAKQGFALYIANFGHYNNKVYGSLGGLIILMMWIYYSAAILLFGGEVASVSAAWSAASRKRRRKR